MGKGIHWELCKEFKFDHTNKLYMYNPEYVLGNEKHKLLWDFEIRTDPLISARRTDLWKPTRKRKLAELQTFLSRLITEQNWKKVKWRINTSTLLENCKHCQKYKLYLVLWVKSPKDYKRTGGLGNGWTSRDHPNYSIIKTGHNTEESPGDLRRPTVTQTSVRNHRLTPVWKTRKGVK